MFPSQNRVAELVRQGKGTSSIAPSTATSAHSTTTRAAPPAAAVKEEKEQSAGTFARMSLALNIVLFLVVLALMAALIVAIVCLRRGKKDKGKTMWVSESKSSMVSLEMVTSMVILHFTLIETSTAISVKVFVTNSVTRFGRQSSHLRRVIGKSNVYFRTLCRNDVNQPFGCKSVTNARKKEITII